ncbi:hypothetical protein ACTXT7_010234 [Hymenolepis weldensis]
MAFCIKNTLGLWLNISQVQASHWSCQEGCLTRKSVAEIVFQTSGTPRFLSVRTQRALSLALDNRLSYSHTHTWICKTTSGEAIAFLKLLETPLERARDIEICMTAVGDLCIDLSIPLYPKIPKDWEGDNYTFMAAYHIVNGAPLAIGLPSKKGGKFPYEFTIPIAGERDEDVQLTFFAKSEELRNAWIKATETALSNQFPPGAKDNGYQFEMATFKQTTYCCMCKKLLQGVFYQGYQCRETGLAAHKACLVNVPTLLPPRTSILLSNGSSGATYHRGNNSHLFRPSLVSLSTPSHSTVFNNHHSVTQSRVSRNTSSVSTDSANSASLHIRTGSNSFETIGGDVFAPPRPLVCTTMTAYSGDPAPPHPIANAAPLGDAVKRPKPLCFGVGEKITLLQPYDGSKWLQVSSFYEIGVSYTNQSYWMRSFKGLNFGGEGRI